MIRFNPLDLLRRYAPAPFDWCEVVVGYDFGILSIAEIQAWVRSRPSRGLEAERLAAMEGAGLARFEETLWAACAEGTGRRVPRPGHQRWTLAQDAWRTVLLKDALEAHLDDAELAEAVDNIADRVGCPEDMLGLRKQDGVWPRKTLSTERSKVEAFVRRLETTIIAESAPWITLAAS